jgi:hypothetical protein
MMFILGSSQIQHHSNDTPQELQSQPHPAEFRTAGAVGLEMR